MEPDNNAMVQMKRYFYISKIPEDPDEYPGFTADMRHLIGGVYKFTEYRGTLGIFIRLEPSTYYVRPSWGQVIRWCGPPPTNFT